jgi:Predicted membrane protein (DUF2142)
MLRERAGREPMRLDGFARSRRLDRGALVALLLACAVLAAGLLATLARETPARTGTNGVAHDTVLSSVNPGARVCQGQELVPAGTAAIELLVPAQYSPGPRLAIELRRGGRLLTRTAAATGAGNVLVHARIPRTTRDLDGVTLCYAVGRGAGPVAAVGGYTAPGTGIATLDGRPLDGSIRIDYLQGGTASWWSRVPTIARRIAMGRGDWGGPWVAWGAVTLVLAALALAAHALWTTVVMTAPASDATSDSARRTTGGRLRRALRRMPAVGWSILAIGALNALAWSLITPPLQVPDEETHVAYAQQIGEAGRPPVNRGEKDLSPELTATTVAARFGWLGAPRAIPALWSPLQERQLQRVLHTRLPRHINGDAGASDPEPPLYYALESIPYRLASRATLLDRMMAMRGLSALMGGLTALLMFLFVRECLPGRAWAWTVGGVGAAFVPLFGFVSGGVNPDALLFAVSAAVFLSLARAFRRGLTMRRAVLVGALLAVGAVTKINFYGLVPGAIAALVLAARVSEGAWNARAAKLAATALAVAVVPFALLMLLDALVWERAFILARTPSAAPQDHGGLGSQLSYLWQVYLPRLPGQAVAFPELSPPYDLWVEGFLGRFGWLTVTYPPWAYRLGAGALAAVVLLASRALVLERAVVRRRAPELAGYALMAASLLLLIGMVALRGWAPGVKGAVQGRYVLPLLALFAALLALAARGAGERAGRAVGAAIVVLAVAWSVFGQLLTIAYYYG